MKQTKTRSVLLLLTIAMLVLTLGLGLVFMQKSNHASADEPSPELVPLADAELLNSTAFKSPNGRGIFWDDNHSQMRLFYKVNNGTPTKLGQAPAGKYRESTLLEITNGGTTKDIKDWAEVAWASNMGQHNGDDKVGEIWINSTSSAWLEGITEVHYKIGFSELTEDGNETDVKTTKDYTLWNGGDHGWLTRVDNTKELEVTYSGGNIAWGGKLDESKLEVKATPKGAQDPVKIDAGCYTLEYDSTKSGQITVTVKYQDLTPKTFNVTVEANDTSKGLKVLHDYSNAQYKTDWGGQGSSNSQLLVYFDLFGEVTPPAVGASNLPFTAGSHVFDSIYINGQPYAQWNTAFSSGAGAWVGSFDAVTPFSSYNAYVLWFNAGNNDWRNTVETVTIKAGFQWVDANGDVADAIVKEDYTLYNAHDAGWQRAVDSISAEYTGGEVEVGSSLDLSKLTVTGKFTDKSADAKIDNSKLTIGALPSEAGQGKVDITYQGKTCQLDVTMKASKTLTGVTVEGTEGATAEQWTYPTFDGITVKAQFEGAEEETLEKGQYTITCDAWTLGQQTATVSYTYAGKTETTTFSFNVTANTATDKYFEILEETRSTNVAFPGYFNYALTYKVNFVDVDIKGLNLSVANYYFDKVKGIHLTDYIEFIYGGETKSAKELFASGELEHIGFSDSGRLVICFKDEASRSKVTQTAFKAGMEIASNQNAFDFNAAQSTLDSTAIFLANGVLKKDYVFFNGGGQGWLKAVETLTATYEGTVLQNGELNRENLTVNATYYGEEQATKLGNNDYTVEFSSAEAGDEIEGTVTYRGKTATFTVKVEAPTKTLERIEVSGTTEFTGKRFGTAPALDGLVVTAYFEGEDEGTVLQTGDYTVGALDMWDTEGDHKIQISYLYGTTTKTAEITLKITAPDDTVHFDFIEGGSHNGYVDDDTAWGKQGQGKGGTRFVWQGRYCLTFPITYTGVADNYPKNVNAIHLEWTNGIHLGEYVKLTYDGQVKTLAELLTDTTVKSVGLSDNGHLIIWFTEPDNCMKVTDVTFLAGMQLPKITSEGIAWSDTATRDQLNQSVELVPGLVLLQDICLWNGDAAGWQLRADSIEAAAKADAKFMQGTADIKSLLEVKAVYGAEKKAITDFTITNYNKDTLGQQTITVTYQDRTATVQITVEKQAEPEPTEYTVTFAIGDHAAANEKAPNEQKAVENGKITLPAAPKAAEGYEFDGWYDGATKAGDANAQYTVTKNVTLTAHWKEVTKPEPEPEKVTVTFNLNGATGTAPAEQTIDKGAKATRPATDPTREGYTFGGWYTDSACTKEFKFDEAVNEDTMVYAKWTKNAEENPGTQPGDRPDRPDQPGNRPEDPNQTGEADNGCGSVIGGVGIALAVMVMLGTALIVLLKRKKNN